MKIKFSKEPNTELTNFKNAKPYVVTTDLLLDGCNKMERMFDLKETTNKAGIQRDIYKLGLQSEGVLLKIQNREFTPKEVIKIIHPNLDEIESLLDIADIKELYIIISKVYKVETGDKEIKLPKLISTMTDYVEEVMSDDALQVIYTFYVYDKFMYYKLKFELVSFIQSWIENELERLNGINVVREEDMPF